MHAVIMLIVAACTLYTSTTYTHVDNPPFTIIIDAAFFVLLVSLFVYCAPVNS